MKNLKLLGLAAVAAMALMAFAASSASATALYNGTTKLGAGAVLDWSASIVARIVWTEGEELDKCSTSTVKGKLSAAATGSIEELTWGSCTFPTTTVTKGKFEVVWTSGTNATIKSDAEIGVTINTTLFGTCVYGVASGTTLGTLTTFSSGAASFDANAVMKKLSGSNFACPPTAVVEVIWTTTEPTNLRVERE
jgi:hypothetical protein